ncbi:transcriptional repressor NsdA [Streptacidiphilus rugosus]|uniref:transcriptional repressor NsdA n=1 Tax=Streptacidiphilus rugosus TaxID=405783 RepID=UPI00056503EF|nr:hypothetical protein [Streptacidiphilus rugosus]
MGDKQPNDKLTAWFVRSGWSKGELARQVNRRARQMGAAHISTDTSRVRRWLDGEQPREPIPKILSELFSDRFGSPVPVEDLGLKAVAPLTPGSGVDLPWTGDQTVQLISEYSRSDLMLNRRGFLGTSLALTAGSALIEPMQRWLSPNAHGLPTTALSAAREGAPVTGRLSGPELDLLESTVVMFRQWDAQNGGGLRRKAVVGQLHEVCDLLQESYSPQTTRRLFQTTAQLAHLAGWMSYDVGMHPSAQKYYVLALHAAKEAGDRPFGALVLTDMCRQMIHLNRPADALELIHLAQYGSRDTASSRQLALMHAMEARAYANLGEAGKCYRAARHAEDSFDDAGQRDVVPDWLTFFSEAELHAENGHSYRDLCYQTGSSQVYALQAEPEIGQAVELFSEDPDHKRSYALNLIGMASVHLLRKEPEAAVASAEQAMEIAARIRSERVNTRLRKTTEAAEREFKGVDSVRRLREQIDQTLPENIATRNTA